jgi:predicted DNA-binding protein
MQKVTSIRLEMNDLDALRQIEKHTGATPAAQIRLAISQYIERWQQRNKKERA